MNEALSSLLSDEQKSRLDASAKKKIDNFLLSTFSKYASEGESCWPWTGNINKKGYGVVTVNIKIHTTVKAHRISWVLHNGTIPNDLCVLHQCDNPRCVNPSHLFLGTRADNNQDMTKKGRLVTRARLTEEEVRYIRDNYKPDRATTKALCDKFGVQRNTITSIAGRRRWASVA